MYNYSHYSGTGNSFLIFDRYNCDTPLLPPKMITNICENHFVDGLIYLEKSVIADYKMRIFNKDGSEAEMCGNGIRCLMDFIQKNISQNSQCSIESNYTIHNLRIENDFVCASMGKPSHIQLNQQLKIDNNFFCYHYLDTGVPHIVLFVDEIDQAPIDTLGPLLRYHKRFAPRGTNVNFVSISDEKVFIRTYERGVEGETLACGTGATAAAYVIMQIYNKNEPIEISFKSKEVLQIHQLNGVFYQSGKVKLIKTGQISLESIPVF